MITLSTHQRDSIYEAWTSSTAPSVVAKVLRLHIRTVISEYVRLDQLN